MLFEIIFFIQNAMAMIRVISAQIQAIPHWPAAICTAHFPPGSRFMEAMAAMQGVYERQKASRETAAAGVSAASPVLSLHGFSQSGTGLQTAHPLPARSPRISPSSCVSD